MFKSHTIQQAVNHLLDTEPPHQRIAGLPHIDKIRVIGPCTHQVLGDGIWELTDLSTGEIHQASTPINGTLEHAACTYYVRSRRVHGKVADKLEFHVCPPQLLQKHNVFGHCDLLSYVVRIFDLLTQKLGIKVSPDERLLWSRGEFKLTEVHLTANFGCPLSAVMDIINAIDQNTPSGKHRDLDSEISLGFTKKRRSKHRVLTVYAKYLKMLEDWPNPGPLQAKIIKEYRNSLRAELKLYSQGLKAKGLQWGWAWKDVDVVKLFFDGIASFNLRAAIQPKLTDHEIETLTLPEFKVYDAWLKGTAVKDQFSSRSTAHKYVRAIYAKTGVDCSANRRPEALPIIDVEHVFSQENVLPVPDWAIGTHCYVPPH